MSSRTRATALRHQVPFVVAIQSHFLEALRTTIVAPMFEVEVMPPERGVILPVTFRDRS